MGVSTSVLRRLNIEALLQFALSTEHFTAAGAMVATGLTRATVLGLCDELIGAGWLEQIEDSRVAGLSTRGRPARRHRLRRDAGILVGVDAGRRGFRAMAVDLGGRALATVRLEVEPESTDREARIALMQTLVREVLDAADAGHAEPLITVIGIPAPVDAEGASPVEVSEFWRLMNPGYPEHLAGRVVVENDANLTVLAESARSPSDNMAALLTSERIGAGLIIDGHLLHGAQGGAGEMRLLDSVLADPHGASGVAFLARTWALEALADGEESPTLAAIAPDDLTSEDVFAAARGGDPLARAVLDRIGDRLARITAILSSLLSVERVVVAGAIAEAVEPVLAHARTVLPEIARAPYPQVVASDLGRDVVVRGAIELALTRLRAAPLDLLDPDTRRTEG